MSEDSDFVGEREQSYEISQIEDKSVVIARRLVRYILAYAESQNTIMNRERLSKALRDFYKEENSKSVPFSIIFEHVNQILFDTYGYELRGISSKAKTSGNLITSGNNSNESEIVDEPQLGAKATHFILLNKLPYLKNFDEFKLEQSIDNYNEMVDQDEYLGDDMERASLNTLENKLGTDQEFAFNGITLIVLCIILFSKNNVLHQELVSYIKSFGVPIDGTDIPILKCSLDELLKTLEKKEYIVKLEETSDIEGSVVMYRIGRRTKYEFDIKSLIRLVEEVMGLSSEQSETLKADIQKTIGDAYK